MKNEITAEQMQDLLKEYEHEIYGAEGMYGGFDLKYLIDSHKRIRQSNLELRSSIYKTRELAQKLGRTEGYREVTCSEYVKVQDLKAMTVLDLANFLADLED